ncbi:MAG: phosphate starvation-inducible protein PsiF [Comamonadaceae bacterium]|nr:MAG: phosphate starvation-inducible protein PsiF [Comamonadaceae bacterium]
MKKLISLSSAALALSLCFAAHAADDKAPTKQQSKMATCNADEKAKTLKGDERKAFMKECLSAGKQEKQQTKMTTCNADAKTKALKGDERKAFMKDCLSNKPAA